MRPRAGEAGRGFAVVAGQVRALAVETSQHLVEAEGAVRGRVSEIADAFGRSGQALTRIATASREVAAGAGETGRASTEVAVWRRT